MWTKEGGGKERGGQRHRGRTATRDSDEGTDSADSDEGTATSDEAEEGRGHTGRFSFTPRGLAESAEVMRLEWCDSTVGATRRSVRLDGRCDSTVGATRQRRTRRRRTRRCDWTAQLGDSVLGGPSRARLSSSLLHGQSGPWAVRRVRGSAVQF